jgi:hypothetical protein
MVSGLVDMGWHTGFDRLSLSMILVNVEPALIRGERAYQERKR